MNISSFLAVETFVNEHTREIRNENVLIDGVAAKLYEITIEEVHRTVEKNKSRFPSDFMFLLNDEEKKKMSLKAEKVYAFTWGGILMLGGRKPPVNCIL